MARKVTKSISINNSMDSIKDSFCSMLSGSRTFRLKNVVTTDEGNYIFIIKRGFNFFSIGEKIFVKLEKVSENETNVIVRSECVMATQFVDWGVNTKNVDKFIAAAKMCRNGAKPMPGAKAAAPKEESPAPEANKPSAKDNALETSSDKLSLISSTSATADEKTPSDGDSLITSAKEPSADSKTEASESDGENAKND